MGKGAVTEEHGYVRIGDPQMVSMGTATTRLLIPISFQHPPIPKVLDWVGGEDPFFSGNPFNLKGLYVILRGKVSSRSCD